MNFDFPDLFGEVDIGFLHFSIDNLRSAFDDGDRPGQTMKCPDGKSAARSERK